MVENSPYGWNGYGIEDVSGKEGREGKASLRENLGQWLSILGPTQRPTTASMCLDPAHPNPTPSTPPTPSPSHRTYFTAQCCTQNRTLDCTQDTASVVRGSSPARQYFAANNDNNSDNNYSVVSNGTDRRKRRIKESPWRLKAGMWIRFYAAPTALRGKNISLLKFFLELI